MEEYKGYLAEFFKDNKIEGEFNQAVVTAIAIYTAAEVLDRVNRVYGDDTKEGTYYTDYEAVIHIIADNRSMLNMLGVLKWDIGSCDAFSDYVALELGMRLNDLKDKIVKYMQHNKIEGALFLNSNILDDTQWAEIFKGEQE